MRRNSGGPDKLSFAPGPLKYLESRQGWKRLRKPVTGKSTAVKAPRRDGNPHARPSKQKRKPLPAATVMPREVASDHAMTVFETSALAARPGARRPGLQRDRALMSSTSVITTIIALPRLSGDHLDPELDEPLCDVKQRDHDNSFPLRLVTGGGCNRAEAR